MEKEKVVEITLKISLTPTINVDKLMEYSPALSESTLLIFDACSDEVAKGSPYAETNVTMDMTDALIEWHKAVAERPGSNGLVNLRSDVILPAIEEAFCQACDMAVKDVIYEDTDAASVVVHDYRKDDITTMEGECV